MGKVCLLNLQKHYNQKNPDLADKAFNISLATFAAIG
jgi:hypothetical protein